MRYFSIICLFFASFALQGQEPTLSQYSNILQVLNPAATGFIPGNESVRLAAFARSQWTPLSTGAYNMSGVVLDARHCMKSGSSWAAGASVQQDGVQLGAWSNLRAYASVAYHHTIDRNWHLAAGFHAGLLQLSLNPGGLMFDNQFGANGYNAGLPTGENFATLSSRALDIDGGLLLYQTQRQFVIGLALHHVNQPRYSFIKRNDGVFDNVLDAGFTLHGSFTCAPPVKITANKHWKIHVLLRKQSTTISGGRLDDQKSQQWQFLGGIQTRQLLGMSISGFIRLAGRSPKFLLADASIVQLNWAYSQGHVGLSYDLNLSRLGYSTQHKGSLELTCSLRLSEFRRCVVCPKF